MSYWGDFAISSTVGRKFTTRQVSGVGTTLAGTPVISAYAVGSNSPITTGITLNVDYPKTGLNDVSVVASVANGFAAGTDYDLVITTGTVNGVSVVGEVVGSFSVANRLAVLATGQKVDVDTIKTNPVVNAGTVTFPANATLASTTNLTAGTIANLTNAPTSGDFTAAMKTSIGTAVAASAVASVTGNVGGNVTGSVGSVVGLTASNLDATVSSRLAAGSYTAPDNASVATILGQTGTTGVLLFGTPSVNVAKVNNVTILGDGSATPFHV